MKPPTQSRSSLLALAVAVFLVTVLPRISDIDMFFDGVHFASAARNLADGVSTFWTPQLTQTYTAGAEYTHPPLGYGILSVFYQIFGQSTLVEELYGVSLGLLILVLLKALWRESRARTGSWYVILLFVTVPMLAHLAANNLLEMPMTVFLLLSALLYMKALRSTNHRKNFFLSSWAGASLFLGVMTKGPAGLFLSVFPAAFATFRIARKRDAALATFSSLLSFAVLAFTVIGLNEEAIVNTTNLYQSMVYGSIQGVGGTGSRYFVFKSLLQELTPALALIGLFALVFRIKKVESLSERPLYRTANAFLVVGLAGTLPFLMTEKQYARYFFPALPFFILSFALYFERTALHLEQMKRNKIRRVHALTAVVLASTVFLCYQRVGQISRNHGYHQDFTLQPVQGLPARPIVSVCPLSLAVDWPLYMDIQRRYRISLSDSPVVRNFHLVQNNSGCEIPNDCTLFHPKKSHLYKLYKCKRSEKKPDQSVSFNF